MLNLDPSYILGFIIHIAFPRTYKPSTDMIFNHTLATLGWLVLLLFPLVSAEFVPTIYMGSFADNVSPTCSLC